jgi:EmrB/QacA subfamily drug resistance transporter
VSTRTETTPPPTTPAVPYTARWLVFAVVMCAEIMDLLDSTVVNVAGPSIRADLGGSTSTLQWLSAGYTLTFAVLLITSARLGDIFGRRRLFLVGVGGFTAASALCALAPSPEVLIGCRVLQGGFGAVLIPQGFGMLNEVFSRDELPKVFGLFGPIVGVASVAGPILAGGLVDLDLLGTGWRLIFLINVPVGLGALVLAWRVLPRTVAAPGTRLDVPGTVLVGTASFALIYPLIQGQEAGWPAWCFVVLGAGVALLVAFVRYEARRGEAPLIERSLMRNRAFTSGLALALAFFASVGGVLLVLSLFCQQGQGFSASRTGLALTPFSLAMVAAMFASFGLAERLGRRLIPLGLVVAALGLVLLAAMVAGRGDVSAWALVPGTAVAGAGIGLVFAQLFDVILVGVSQREIGSASGILNATQQLAFALGVAAVATLFLAELGRRPSGDALAITALATLAPLAVSLVLAFRLPPKAAG